MQGDINPFDYNSVVALCADFGLTFTCGELTAGPFRSNVWGVLRVLPTDEWNMNPAVWSYSTWMTASTLLALSVIAWRAHRYCPDSVTGWLDVGIAAVLGGIVGARLLHVVVEWRYFSDHTDEIARLSSGGLMWHGALITGIPAALAMAWVRQVPVKPWSDAAALAWPVGLAGAWLACRHARCAYGCEVQTLADWPGWMVEELPDIYGTVAPRLDIQLMGAMFGGVLFALALLLTWRNWLPGLRFWLVLALTGLSMVLFGFFRADPSRMFYQRRVDQVFDLVVLLVSTVIGGMIWLLDRRIQIHREIEQR
jgi:phosphatidylglycerol:prolipoprotein diacylglycerol transferase